MKLRLLVADDEELARASIRKMIESLFDNFGEIAEVERGDEVVEKARDFHPDLVFVDVRMPGLNGLDAAAQILASRPGTRIVVVTAYDRFSLAQRAVNLGLDGYLLKPVIEEEFRRTVSEVIRRIEREPRRGGLSVTPAPNPGLLPGSALTAIEDRLIRSLLRGRLPSADEAADELLLAWGSAGTDCPRRLRVFAFALAREAERYVSVGGMIDHITLALAPDSLVGGGGVRRALAELLMAWTGSLATEGEDPGRRIIDWLSETPAHELSLDALAQRLRCSTASASRLFKEATGRSFAAYAGELRLERAVALVSGEGAELTLEELARKVGYSDSAYFGRLFKEHTGMSPREFARSARGGRQEVPRL